VAPDGTQYGDDNMQLEPLPRRSFLKLGLMTGAVAVAVLNGCTDAVTSFSGARRTPYGTLLILDEEQARTMEAFAETVVPSAKDFPSAREARVVQRLDEELFFVSGNIAADVKTVLDVLEWMPVAYGYFSRFSRLSPDKRLAFLNGTKNTGSATVRAVIHNCRMICFNLYYGHQSTWAAIGYDGPFSGIPEQLGEQRRYYAELIGSAQSKG